MTQGRNLFLVLSNVAFLLPATLAFRMRLWYEASVFVLMMIVSGWYHILDTSGGATWIISYRTAQLLDFYMAFALITRTALMVMYNESRTEFDPNRLHRNTQLKLLVHPLADLVALALVLEDVPTDYVILVLSGLVLVFLIIAAGFYRHNFVDVDWLDLLVGAIVITAASICYFIVPNGRNYWIAHSWWHIGAALGTALMVEALNRDWTCLTCLCNNNQLH